MNRKWFLLGLVVLLVISAFGSVSAQGFDPMAYLIEPEVDAKVERLENNDLVVSWVWEADRVIIYWGFHPDVIETEPIAVVEGAQETTLTGLDPASRYYFTLAFVGGDHDDQTLVVAERILPLEGSVNFRDIGGYRTADGLYTKWGMVYRSGELNNLTNADLDYLLNNIRLRLVCDFRSQDEIDAAPDRLPADEALRTINLPVFDDSSDSTAQLFGALMSGDPTQITTMFSAMYVSMLDTRPEVFAGMLKEFADPANLPAAYHCTAGKDRAGVATAMLLSLLGVPDETIVADFSLSNLAFDELLAVTAENPSLAAAGLSAEMLAPILIADPAWIEATLEHLHATYGSVEEYLMEQGGLDADTIAAIRRNLLQLQ